MESTCTYYMDLVWLSWAVENTTRSGKLDETEVNDKCVHKVWVRPKKIPVVLVSYCDKIRVGRSEINFF